MIRYKRLPGDIYRKIGLLAETLQDDHDIAFMYLFGGLLNKKLNPLSDIDIAVYLKSA
jgi:predicted nucleotidyltransferase